MKLETDLSRGETRRLTSQLPLSGTDRAVLGSWRGFASFAAEMAAMNVELTFVADDEGHFLRAMFEEHGGLVVRVPWPMDSGEQLVAIEYTRSLAASPTSRDRDAKALWPGFAAFAEKMKAEGIRLYFDRDRSESRYCVRIVLMRRSAAPQVFWTPWPHDAGAILITETFISEISLLRQGRRVQP